jgi:hypothetical protein
MAKLGPLPDVQDVVKIRLLGKMPGGTNWANVLHAQVQGVKSTATLNTCALNIRGYWSTDLAPLINLGVTLSTVEITDLTSRSGAQGVDTVGAAGTLSGVAAPNSVAACLTLKIPNRYRGGHPRMYLPGVNNVNVLNGSTWNTGVASNYTAGGRAFMNHINALIVGSTVWKLCAVSYYKTVGGAPAYKTPPEVYIVSDVLCHTRVDSMRPRLGKETS